jgi:hypothetical protein
MMKSEEYSIEDVVCVLVDDPVGDTVHQPYAAYSQGFAAHGLGLVLTVNPYPNGREFTWWDMGWKDARDQDDDDVGPGVPCLEPMENECRR